MARRLKEAPAISPGDAAIAVLSHQRSGPVHSSIRTMLIKGTRKQIAAKAKASPDIPWTPELVLKRLKREAEPSLLTSYSLAGIDDEKLLDIARQALTSIGIQCCAPAGDTRQKRGAARSFLLAVKSLFWISGDGK